MRKELETFVNILANLLDDTQSYQGYHIYLCVIHTMSVVSSVEQGCQVFQSEICSPSCEIMLHKANFSPEYAHYKNP